MRNLNSLLLDIIDNARYHGRVFFFLLRAMGSSSNRTIELSEEVRELIRTTAIVRQNKFWCLVPSCTHHVSLADADVPGKIGFLQRGYLREHYREVHGLKNSDIASTKVTCKLVVEENRKKIGPIRRVLEYIELDKKSEIVALDST